MGITIKRLGSWWMIVLLSVACLAAQGSDLRLTEAASRGDRKAVRSLLKEQVDVNLAQGDGATALHWAAHWNDLEMAALLIGAGANVNAANDYGVTPLSEACTNRSDALVTKLLTAGADASATQWTGETVLMTCALTGNLKAVKSLLTHGADPNKWDNRWEQTALMWALAGGHSIVARTLVEHGANIRARSSAGFTPLMFAAQQGDMDSLRLLLEKGATVNGATPKHGNVLTVASASGHETLSIFLLEKGADPNSPGDNGVTALHYAIAAGLSTMNGLNYDKAYRLVPPNMPKLVKALLEHGAEPNGRITIALRLGPDDASTGLGLEGATPFFLAALSGDAELLQVLAAHGADPRLRAKGEATALMAAAGAARGMTQGTIKFRLGNPLEAVKVVMEVGGDVHATTETGQTALHAAAFAGEDEVVQFLVDRGAEVDAQDNDKQTPWSMAQGISPRLGARGSYGSHPTTAALLLKLGATVRSREDMIADGYTVPPVPVPKTPNL